jgi:pimeloyl-ACP methyl ester carboxylesterase
MGSLLPERVIAMQPKHDTIATRYESASSRYMPVGGLRLHYCVEGRGPTLVLLHGELSSLHTWEGWVQRLSSHYRIVRIDLPGFGLSEHLASHDYTPEYGVELLERMRSQLNLEHFSLAGNSLGGFLSWYYAAHHPERIDKLILIDPIGYPQKLPSMVALLSLPLIGELARWMAPRFMVARNVRGVYGDPNLVSDEVVDRYHQLLSHGKNRAALIRTFRRLRTYRNDPELCRQIPRVRAPTLLMWGGRDRWVPPSLIDAWRRDLPTAEVKIYPEAGHFPMEELPDVTAEDASAFLSIGEEERVVRESHAEPIVPFVFAREA